MVKRDVWCVKSRVTHHLSEVADESFFLQAVNPLFLQTGLLLGVEGFLDFATNFGERLGVRVFFILDGQEINGVGGFNDVAGLAGVQREGGGGEFLAEDGAFDPAQSPPGCCWELWE